MQCKSLCGYARESFGPKSQIKQYEINLRCPFLLCTPLRIQVIKLSRQGIGNRLNDGNILYSQCFSSWTFKVGNILKGSLDSIPSPSAKIQIMAGKACMRCRGKTLLVIVNNYPAMFCLITSSKLSCQ